MSGPPPYLPNSISYESSWLRVDDFVHMRDSIDLQVDDDNDNVRITPPAPSHHTSELGIVTVLYITSCTI
jgi:hypothetical protein